MDWVTIQVSTEKGTIPSGSFNTSFCNITLQPKFLHCFSDFTPTEIRSPCPILEKRKTSHFVFFICVILPLTTTIVPHTRLPQYHEQITSKICSKKKNPKKKQTTGGKIKYVTCSSFSCCTSYILGALLYRCIYYKLVDINQALPPRCSVYLLQLTHQGHVVLYTTAYCNLRVLSATESNYFLLHHPFCIDSNVLCFFAFPPEILPRHHSAISKSRH